MASCLCAWHGCLPRGPLLLLASLTLCHGRVLTGAEDGEIGLGNNVPAVTWLLADVKISEHTACVNSYGTT